MNHPSKKNYIWQLLKTSVMICLNNFQLQFQLQPIYMFIRVWVEASARPGWREYIIICLVLLCIWSNWVSVLLQTPALPVSWEVPLPEAWHKVHMSTWGWGKSASRKRYKIFIISIKIDLKKIVFILPKKENKLR